MYSFLVTPGTTDTSSVPHTTAAIKGEENYEFFTFKGKQPVTLQYRGKPFVVEKGTRFGVRPSVNKKDIRLIFKGEPNRVFTLTMDQANQLAKGV